MPKITTITKKDVARRTAKLVGEKIYTTEKIVDGKTTGKRTKLWGTNKAKELADWIEGRCVEKFQSATREKIDDLFFISQLYQDRYS